MKLQGKFFKEHKTGLISTALAFALGYVLLVYDFPLSQFLTHASYDMSFDLCSFAQSDLSGCGVVIVYIDEESLKDLNQPMDQPMDRSIHARLLRKLKADGAKAVVMDIIFGDPHHEGTEDAEFADAIAENGKVVLGVDYNPADAANAIPLANSG